MELPNPLTFVGFSKKQAAVVVCCALVCVIRSFGRLSTPTTEMRKPILYSIKIDVTSKDWCPIPALLVIAQAQKPGATHNKGGLQFWEDQYGLKKASGL